MRLDAYYYGFDSTGVDSIDLILSAVACAGKAFHSTDCWTDEADPSKYNERLRGETMVEGIQNAANDAAKLLADRDAEIERLRAELALRKDYADQCRAQDATIHRLKLELDAYERAVREARDGVS